MKHSEDLQGRAAGLVDDQVGEDSIKENRAAGEIGPPMPHSGHFGQPVNLLKISATIRSAVSKLSRSRR